METHTPPHDHHQGREPYTLDDAIFGLKLLLELYILVIVHDGVEAMCYSNDCAVAELSSDGILNEVICLKVYSSCGLIKDEDLGLTKESSC